MKKNKEKIKALMVAATLVAVFLIAAFPSVLGGTTDTFTVTVRGEYLDIQINQTTWQINSGNAVTLSTSYWTNETYNNYFQATVYNCSVTVDLKLHVSGAASDWSRGDAVDADTYRINASTDVFASDNTTVGSSATVISSSIAKDSNETFDLRFDAPTSTTTGNTQTITLTATVIKS